jgi:hypothetical protein
VEYLENNGDRKMRKYLFLVSLLIGGCAGQQPYATVGAGYKFDEFRPNVKQDGDMYLLSDPFSARLEIGIDGGKFQYGISHHSQWFSGKPFNDKLENQKTEVFFDYTHKFSIIK